MGSRCVQAGNHDQQPQRRVADAGASLSVCVCTARFGCAMLCCAALHCDGRPLQSHVCRPDLQEVLREDTLNAAVLELAASMFAVGLQGSAALGLGYLILNRSLFDSFRCVGMHACIHPDSWSVVLCCCVTASLAVLGPAASQLPAEGNSWQRVQQSRSLGSSTSGSSHAARHPRSCAETGRANHVCCSHLFAALEEVFQAAASDAPVMLACMFAPTAVCAAGGASQMLRPVCCLPCQWWHSAQRSQPCLCPHTSRP